MMIFRIAPALAISRRLRMVSQSSKGNTVMKADFESLKEVVETLKASNDAKHAETHGHLADLKRDVSAILELLTTDAAPTSSLLSRRRQVTHSTPATTAAAVSFADLKFQSSEVAEAKSSTSTRRSLSRGGSGSDSKSASEDGGKYHVNVELKSLNMDDEVDVDKHVADIYERALRVHAEAKRALEANDRDRARRAQKIAANKAKALEKQEVDSSMSFDADTDCDKALRNRSAVAVEKTPEAQPSVLDLASEDGEMDVLEEKAAQTSKKATASTTSTPVFNRSTRISAKGSISTPPITSLSTVCCIPSCTSGKQPAGRKPKVDLLPFPAGEDGDLWMRWISDVHETAGVDVEDLDKATSVVCSLHFPTGGGNDPKVPIPLYFPCNSKGRAPRVVIGPLPSQESPKSGGEEDEEGELSAEKKKPAKSKKKASKSRTVEVVVELPTESDEEKERQELVVEKPKPKSQRKREHSPEASATQNEEVEEETAEDKPLKQKSPSKKKKKGKKAKSERSKPTPEAKEDQKDDAKQAEDNEESATPKEAVAKDKKKKKGKGKPKSKSRDSSAADDYASAQIQADNADVPEPAVIPADASKEPEVDVTPAATDLDIFKAKCTGGTKKAKKTFPAASMNGPPAKKAKVKLDLCCVVGCPNNREATRKSHCNLRSFPEAQDVRMQWINAILPCQRDKCWLPSANDLVCTEHFAIDVGVTETNTIDISPKSIPTKFPWNQPEVVSVGPPPVSAAGTAVATVEKPSRAAPPAAEMGANTSPRARRTKRRCEESEEAGDGESVQKTSQVEQNGGRETEQQEDNSGANAQTPNEPQEAKSATVNGVEQVDFGATNGRDNALASDEQAETVEEQSTPRIKAMPKRFKEAALAKLKQTSASAAITANGDESDAADGQQPDGHALVEGENAASGGIAALADSVEYPANALSALSSVYADAGSEGGNPAGLSGHAGTAATVNQAADRTSPDLFPDSDPSGGIRTGPGPANADDGPDYEGADGASTGFDFPADAFDDELAAQRGGEVIPGLGGLQDPAADLFSFRAGPPEAPGLPPSSFLDTSGGSNPGAAADPSGFALPRLGDFLERGGLIGADAFVGQHATGEMMNELND